MTSKLKNLKLGEEVKVWNYGSNSVNQAEVDRIDGTSLRFRVTSNSGRTVKVTFDINKDQKSWDDNQLMVQLYSTPLAQAMRETNEEET